MSRLATTWMPVLTVAYMAATMAQVAHGEDAAAAASASDSTESLLKPSFTQCVDIMTGGDLFNAACVKLVQTTLLSQTVSSATHDELLLAAQCITITITNPFYLLLHSRSS